MGEAINIDSCKLESLILNLQKLNDEDIDKLYYIAVGINLADKLNKKS